MDLGNPASHRFPLVNALMYVMHIGKDLWWTMMQGYQLSWFTKLLYCMDFQPWEDIKPVPKSIGSLTYGWDLKVVIYPYRLGYYYWRFMAVGILNRGIMISHGIETTYPLGWCIVHVIMKSMAIVIHLVKFDICSLALEYVNWSHNKWD